MLNRRTLALWILLIVGPSGAALAFPHLQFYGAMGVLLFIWGWGFGILSQDLDTNLKQWIGYLFCLILFVIGAALILFANPQPVNALTMSTRPVMESWFDKSILAQFICMLVVSVLVILVARIGSGKK